MKTKKTKKPNYPTIAILDDGTELVIPRQSQFHNEWLRKHGCSLMAEYVALQFVGVHKWPIRLLVWHRKHTPDDIYAKVTVKGVAKGIATLGKGKAQVQYIAKPTADKIQEAMNEGAVIVLEQGSPIHTVTLLPDRKGIYCANAGTVRKTTAEAKAKKATSSKRYRGMVIVRRLER